MGIGSLGCSITSTSEQFTLVSCSALTPAELSPTPTSALNSASVSPAVRTLVLDSEILDPLLKLIEAALSFLLWLEPAGEQGRPFTKLVLQQGISDEHYTEESGWSPCPGECWPCGTAHKCALKADSMPVVGIAVNAARCYHLTSAGCHHCVLACNIGQNNDSLCDMGIMYSARLTNWIICATMDHITWVWSSAERPPRASKSDFWSLENILIRSKRYGQNCLRIWFAQFPAIFTQLHLCVKRCDMAETLNSEPTLKLH